MRRVILTSLLLLTFLLPIRLSNANDIIKLTCPNNGTITVIIKHKTKLLGAIYFVAEKIKFKKSIHIDFDKFHKKYPNNDIVLNITCK